MLEIRQPRAGLAGVCVYDSFFNHMPGTGGRGNSGGTFRHEASGILPTAARNRIPPESVISDFCGAVPGDKKRNGDRKERNGKVAPPQSPPSKDRPVQLAAAHPAKTGATTKPEIPQRHAAILSRICPGKLRLRNQLLVSRETPPQPNPVLSCLGLLGLLFVRGVALAAVVYRQKDRSAQVKLGESLALP